MVKIRTISLILIVSIMLTACSDKRATVAPVHVTATPTPMVSEEMDTTEQVETVSTSDSSSSRIPDTYPVKNSGDILNDPFAFVEAMAIGWNLGNTFDANSDTNPANEMDLESSWSGIVTTREMIQAVYDRGFRSIRIPISWHNHVSGEDFTISEQWLDRIQEVVDYAYELGMFVIINTHHDVYPQYYYPLSIYMDGSNHYISCIWTQVAERFKDYDEHLIFESLNEPRLKDTSHEWTIVNGCRECKDSMECINILNQTFVDAVRATGGNNADRYLMVPGYDASAEGALNDAFALPYDSAKNRIIVSVHAYTPYWFALADEKLSNSTDKFDPESKASTVDIDNFMKKLYDKFISQGIPVVIGEFGSRNKGFNNEARIAHATYYVSLARSYGMSCLWWDNNSFTGDGENFGLLSRSLLKWRFDDIIDAMMEASKVYQE